MPKTIWAMVCWMLLALGQASALEIVSVTPNRGAPGTLVTVSGGPFSSAAQTFLGNRDVAPRQIVEDRLEFAVPYLPAGDYLLTVRDGDMATEQTFQFEVMAPTPRITGLSPSNLDVCRTGAEHQLGVEGHNFLAGAMVLIDDIAVPTTFVNKTSLEARLEGFEQPGVFGVMVRNPDGATSLPHSLWIDNIPEITSVEAGAEAMEHYEVIIHGRNFQLGSTLVVKEPEDSVIGQAYRHFSYTAGSRATSTGRAVNPPQRDRLVFIDCRTLIYHRYPNISQVKNLGLMVLNPDGHKTDMYHVDLP